jgi:VCBS repeat-containing protein
VWSPLGDKIAFESNVLGNSDIYTMNTDGTARLPLTGDTTQFDDHTRNPSWSPDGLRIAFDSNEPNGVGGVNVWTVDASDGGNAVNVTGSATGSDDDTNPAWSPDGAKIAFTRAGGTIWTINPDGTGLAQVNAGPPATQKEADWRPAVVGVDDAYAVDEGATLVVPTTGVLTNDGTVGALPAATAAKVTDPVNGSLTLNADGSFTYTHDGSETTTDSFTYRPVQGATNGSIATVTITINPKNDAPKAVDDGPYVTENGGTVTQPAPGVLANDSDAEGNAMTAVLKTDVSNGTLTLNADGSFTYTHDGSDTKLDSFTYQAKDSKGALSNVATVTFTIGAKPSGVHTVGLVDPASGKWYLYDDAGKLKTSFFYGNPGDYPFMGDWNGDGIETPGLYRQSDGFVYLRNSNTQGIADIRFFFGNPGDVPIAGDFNGDGFDTVSIYRPSNQTFYIINKLGANDGGLGAAETSYVFGNPGDKPFVGDFDGDGVETVGLHRESTGLVYFRNTHTQGIADNQFIFGNPGDRLVAGDWTNDATFTPALYRPSDTTMYFRHTNTQGNADNQFIPVPTDSTWLPVSGYTGD